MLLAPAHVLKGTKNKAASGENGHHQAGGAVTNLRGISALYSITN